MTIVGLPIGNATPAILSARYTTATRKASPEKAMPRIEISCSG